MSEPYTTSAHAVEPVDNSRNHDSQSLGELLGNVTRDISTLMRQEVALAKAELKETATKAGAGVGMLAGAALGGFFLLLFLSIALWEAVSNGPGRGWAALIVALVWAIIAAVLALVGKKQLDKIKGLPETADTVGKIPNALKGKEEDNR